VNLTTAWLATNETGTWINWTKSNYNTYGSPVNVTFGENPPTAMYQVNFTWSNSSLEGNVSINWKVYLNDSSGNVAETGVMNFSLLPTISISTLIGTVDFGSLVPGLTNQTQIGAPPLPFTIINDGNYYVNLTIYATDLFRSANPNPTEYYLFNSSVNETGSVEDTALDLINIFTNVSAAGKSVKLATRFNWTDINDEIRVHINITIPLNESASGKNSTITFTASQAR